MIPILILCAVIFGLFTYRLSINKNPIEWSGPRLLSEELKMRGIPMTGISRDFYEESISIAKHIADSAHARPAERREEFKRQISKIAGMLSLWRRDPGHPMFSPTLGDAVIYRELFVRHCL
ncbi:hypothetical protein [Stenotrophomonas daejeonensis]|uniref:hypothetical protein n=1 Tax=Stenotrophomonas daejeonensis TaxID=659018 RepID=UPI00128EA8C5|nr:hypothetical protein [Stenotrophomonas daejeonensis]